MFFIDSQAAAPNVLYRIFPLATTGQTILVTHVYQPTDMSDPSHAPVVPAEYHRAIVDYAKGVAFGSSEDNAELDTYYRGLFAQAVSDLKMLRLTREGPDARDRLAAAVPQGAPQ